MDDPSQLIPTANNNVQEIRRMNLNTRSHGGGYNPVLDEYWYPQWSGSTVYRYSRNQGYLGSFNTNGDYIMGMWVDIDNYYYTARWSRDVIYKIGPYPSTTLHWSTDLGIFKFYFLN